MLQIVIPSTEMFDEAKQEFINYKGQTLQLEHSLVSLSKWESKWCKPFLSKNSKTVDETLDYIKCMTITQNVDDDVYNHLSTENITEINNYISAPMTATYFNERATGSHSSEQTTAEMIYYWMIAFNIPFECQKWHLNKLLTLIRVCNIKQQSPKKMSKRDVMSRNAQLNAARRAKMNSNG